MSIRTRDIWHGLRCVALGLVMCGVSTGLVKAQEMPVQVLHRFAFGAAPQSPIGVASVPEGGAMVVTRATPSVASMIVRVLPNGTVRVLHVMPYAGESDRQTQVATPLVRGGDGG